MCIWKILLGVICIWKGIGDYIVSIQVAVTDRVRSTMEGNAYIWECLSVHKGGVSYPS